MPTGSPRDNWSAAILIGGTGQRLGGADKVLLSVGGQTILARQTSVLAASGFETFLVTRPTHHLDSAWPIVADTYVGCGPLGGIHAALTRAREGHLLVLAGDMPFLTPRFLDWMASLAEPDACVVPSRRGRLHPLCAVYPASAAARVAEAIRMRRLAVRDVLPDLRCRVVDDIELEPFDPDGMLFFNVNTPEDLARARDYDRALAGSPV